MELLKVMWLLLALSLLGACGGGGGGGPGGNTSPATPLPTNSVSGTALFNGAPLAGATIVAFEGNTGRIKSSAITDANGNYTFTELFVSSSPIWDLQFYANKPGYSFNPFMAANPSGNRSGYQWYAPAQNWSVNTSAAITRAGFNGAFSNPNGGAGIMFNIINFYSLANNSISGANFNAYDGSNPPAKLATTGQTTSYVSGDDGALKKGTAWPNTRYSDNQNGTVTDNLTGLIWMKNAACFTPTQWASALASANQLASGTCGLTDGSKAGDWRLPNIVELESLVDASASNPAITAGNPFTNVSTGIYWTSTSYYGGAAGSPSAWTIRMSDGRYINDSGSSNLNLKSTANNAVWAVKGSASGPVKLQATGFYVFYANGDDGTIESGAPLPAPRMIDNANGTVTDTLTGLVWLKQADCIKQNWSVAISAINALASGQCGLTDGSTAGSWRMPNRKEMQSLADRAQNNMADYFDASFIGGIAGINFQEAPFTNFMQLQYYWTSTTDAADTSKAWTTYSCDFGVYDIPKATAGYSLAVR